MKFVQHVYHKILIQIITKNRIDAMLILWKIRMDGIKKIIFFQIFLFNFLYRILDRRESVSIYTNEQCMQRYKEQNRQLMFFPNSNLCAGRKNEENIEIVCTIN